jgi:anthranilate phosphoribosyltransferase
MKNQKFEQVASIQLKGEPYRRTFNDHKGKLITVDANESLDELAERSGYIGNLPQYISQVEDLLHPLFEQGGYYGIDAKLKHGENLTFEEAFSLITFVVSALNKPLSDLMINRIQNLGPTETHTLQAVALLSSMSTKEGFTQLKPEEIAGMVAATIHLDTVIRTHHSENVLGYGGMGGDKGYPRKGENSKLFSLSTLSSIASAILVPTHKHHSYPNTSKIAGQSAIEAFGARSDFHSAGAFEAVFRDANLLMTSCHNTRTLHTLSHLLRGETINHVIGPLAFTIANDTTINGFIGVNEKIHPQTIIDALKILDDTGHQSYGNSAVYCGTDLENVRSDMLDPDRYYASSEAKNHVRLDEIAPPPFASLVSFSVSGESVGTYSLHPSDFYSTQELNRINYNGLLIPNTKEDILHFNMQAITGKDEAKSRYLAMTVGLGIFVRKYLHLENALNPQTHRVNQNYLRMATNEAYELLRSGRAEKKLDEYVLATQKYAGS